MVGVGRFHTRADLLCSLTDQFLVMGGGDVLGVGVRVL